MKDLKIKIATLLVTVILLGAQTNLFAQSGNGKGMGYGHGNGNICNNLPGITDEQKSKIQELKVIQMKSRQTTQNIIREKRAHLITLQTADKVDMGAINKTIDDITALQNSQWKKRAEHKQAIRNLLTNEQKVYFDSSDGKHGHGFGKGQCNGKKHGHGHKNFNN